MICRRLFSEPYQFFHINFSFHVHPYFRLADWTFFCSELNLCAQAWQAEIHAFVMMDTHCHVLYRIDHAKENFFAAELIRRLNADKTNEDSTLVEPIKNQSQYYNTCKYIFRNPVDAGLVSHCEDYPYSSLSLTLGRFKTDVALTDYLGLIQNPYSMISWLNNKKQLYKISPLKFLDQANSELI